MGREPAARRRGKELEEAIYQAVWDELQEVGFTKLTMDGVAKRAGTSKPVLYRRWPGRIELLAAAAVHFMPDRESIPDTGSIRDDTVALLSLMRTRMLTLGRSPMLGLLIHVSQQPEAEESHFLEQLQRNIRNLMTNVVIARALERGEATPEQLNDRLQMLPIDLARSQFLLTGDLPEGAITEIVDDVFMPALAGRAGQVRDSGARPGREGK
ncbi:TetR/AcrR family transcriptional regulator [Glycomyces buryatensis]|uniref:TetR/AcrR family transcriptional regulator n=1 Tax=Glycomyces buryatensis TaxID=2570927 RepID=A0A4V4HSC2_9ACTN|nr:TetR/AcrR family transcriptional regulator [Glycomyces buryatensis]THV41146.1 TetR/AcrR family transcriptional regulator [Glycomyces buryatensis]